MKVSLRSVEKVVPYARNPRKNDEAVDAVAASIKEFGFRQPIVVDRDGVIICGETRFKAARRLGLKKVPVHVAEGLTPAQIKAYRIADNRLGEVAAWDMELLPLELSELKAADEELELLGFDDDELARLLDASGAVESWGDALDRVPSDERPGFQQMTFTLSNAQAETVNTALQLARDKGVFVDTGNENRNGNALARIAEAYH